MKNIFYIIGIAGCMAASCTEIEPLEMQAGGIPQDTETIREFKAAEHPLTMVWFDSWKADGNMNTYLNTLPDSIDMVVLEQGYEDITPLQQTDLETVQTSKSTRILILAEFDTWTAEYKTKIEEAEIEGENIAYEAAEAEDRDATDEEIETAIAAECAKVDAEFDSRFSACPEQLEKWVSANNYDGICLRISAADNAFVREKLNTLIAAIGSKFGKKAGNKTLILEGTPEYFAEHFECFDYMVSTTLDTGRLSHVQDEYDRLKKYAGFEPKKFLAYVSLEDDAWKTPFEDLISSQPLSETKNLTLASWIPADGESTGGIAVKGIENDYEQDYATLRATIQYLNLNHK